MFSDFLKPRFSHTGIAVGERSVSVARTESDRDSVRVRNHAEVALPVGVVSNEFSIGSSDFDVIADSMRDCAERAGLADKKSWSLALPHGSAKMATFTLDTEPKSQSELREILEWKASTAFGMDVNNLRLASERISDDVDGKVRQLVTAVSKDVLAQYEDIFSNLGWSVGLVLPRSLAESSLLAGFERGDSLLLSFSGEGFNGIVLRGDDPLVVRNVTCSAEESADELYRLMLFYSDRFGSGDTSLARLLATGAEFDLDSLAEVCTEALGYRLEVLDGGHVSMPADLVHSDSALTAIGVSSVVS